MSEVKREFQIVMYGNRDWQRVLVLLTEGELIDFQRLLSKLVDDGTITGYNTFRPDVPAQGYKKAVETLIKVLGEHNSPDWLNADFTIPLDVEEGLQWKPLNL
jgi:hypothetical protein